MTKKITDEERQFFRDAVSDVKPLKQTHQPEIKTRKTGITPPAEKKVVKRISIRPPEPEEKIIFHFTEKHTEIAGEDIIAFSRSGLQKKRFTQLRQEKKRIEATLDLHQHTIDEAIHATDHFLKQSHHKNLRSVCIIHGKGHYSADHKPVIKNLLNQYLRQHP